MKSLHLTLFAVCYVFEHVHAQSVPFECTQKSLKVKKEGEKNGFKVDFTPDMKKLSTKIKNQFHVIISASKGPSFDLTKVCFDIKGISEYGAVLTAGPARCDSDLMICEQSAGSGFFTFVDNPDEWTKNICPFANNIITESVRFDFTAANGEGQVAKMKISGCVET